VAIVDGMLQVTSPGSAGPALSEPVTAVMTKQGDQWLIAASRVTAPTVSRSA
jgi:ketosteroid isomerase-like protein